jgi:hypothetical protein
VSQFDPVVFVNYRRCDEPETAALLATKLSHVLGREAVFFDSESIELGVAFPAVLLDAVRRCAVVLAVIGRNWFATSPSGGRLVDDSDDWVRLEILTALAAGVRVVPVLVVDVAEVSEPDLPDELAIMARLQFARIRDRYLIQDIGNLVDTLVAQVPRITRRAGGHAGAGGRLDLREARGIQIGGHNVQHNRFA